MFAHQYNKMYQHDLSFFFFLSIYIKLKQSSGDKTNNLIRLDVAIRPQQDIINGPKVWVITIISIKTTKSHNNNVHIYTVVS